MRQSENIDQLAKALALAQAAMPHAIFNQVNPHFKSRYADLAAIADATVPHLSKNGLSISQTPDYEDGRYILITTLLHVSGQWKAGVMPLLDDVAKPQSMQSDLTYKKRGGWSAICGVAVAGEDDDGNVAEQGGSKAVSPVQLDELMTIAHERGVDTIKFCEFVTEQFGYKVENLSMIRAADVGRATTWLKQKRKEGQHGEDKKTG